MFDALSEISLDDRIKVDYSEANRILKNAGMDPAYGVKYLYPVREWLQ